MEFINENYISSLLESKKLSDIKLQKDVITKAKECKGLTLEESAALLNIEDEELIKRRFLLM